MGPAMLMRRSSSRKMLKEVPSDLAMMTDLYRLAATRGHASAMLRLVDKMLSTERGGGGEGEGEDVGMDRAGGGDGEGGEAKMSSNGGSTASVSNGPGSVLQRAAVMCMHCLAVGDGEAGKDGSAEDRLTRIIDRGGPGLAAEVVALRRRLAAGTLGAWPASDGPSQV